MRLALDERTPPNEALAAATGAFRLIEEFKLLATRKRVDVAAEIVNKIVMSPDIAEGVAIGAERIADSVGRVVGSVKNIMDRFTPPERDGSAPRGRRRRKYARD